MRFSLSRLTLFTAALGVSLRPFRVVAGHSRTKDGVALLAYAPAIHDDALRM